MLSIIGSHGSEAHPAAVGRVDESEAVEFALSHEVQGNLARGIEIVAAKIHLESERLIIAKFPRVVAGYIVTLVAQRVQERSVGAGALIGHERVNIFDRWTVGEECPIAVKRPALNAPSELVRKAFSQPDMNYAKSEKSPYSALKGPLRIFTS